MHIFILILELVRYTENISQNFPFILRMAIMVLIDIYGTEKCSTLLFLLGLEIGDIKGNSYDVTCLKFKFRCALHSTYMLTLNSWSQSTQIFSH